MSNSNSRSQAEVVAIESGSDNHHDDSESDPDDEEEYIVEAIRKWSYDATERKKKFLIKWKGWSEKENTWEPEDHLHCEDRLAEFKASLDGEDLICFNHPDQDGLTGFQRHATFTACVGVEGPHDSDIDEDSDKPDKQKFYCLLQFKDSGEKAEEVTLDEFFKHEPEAAFKFVEQRLLSDNE